MIENCAFLGQPNCFRLSNGQVDLIVSTDIGPRVLRYGFVGQENVLGEYPDLRTPTTWGNWKPWGGHRLWVAPEEMPLSYAPDNEPVAFEILGANTIRLTQPTDRAEFEKVMTVQVGPSASHVTLEHQITNRRRSSVRISAWAITIMSSAGVALIPQEPFRSHDDYLLPARSIVVWHFTDLTDPRITLGRKFIRLQTEESKPDPQKIGAANRQGWCGYYQISTGMLLIKRVNYDASATYPDFGANSETYTAGNYIEIETLGPLEYLESGQTTSHTEEWFLFSDVQLGGSDDEIEQTVLPLLEQTQRELVS